MLQPSPPPIPISRRQQTAAARRAFLDSYATTGKIADGLAAAAVTRRTFNYWRQDDPAFAASFNALRDACRAPMLLAARERATQGDYTAWRWLRRHEQPARYGYNKHPLPTAAWHQRQTRLAARRQNIAEVSAAPGILPTTPAHLDAEMRHLSPSREQMRNAPPSQPHPTPAAGAQQPQKLSDYELALRLMKNRRKRDLESRAERGMRS